jgi:hypothetical protein
MKNTVKNFEDGTVVMSFAVFVKDLTGLTTQARKNKENMDYLEECYVEYINDSIKPKYSVSTFHEAVKLSEQIISRNYYLANRDHILDNINYHQVKQRLELANRHASEEEINKMLESELKRIKEERLALEQEQKDILEYNTYDSRSPGFKMSVFANAVKERNLQKQQNVDMDTKECHNQQKAKAKLVKVSDDQGNQVVGNDIESAQFATGGGASVTPSNKECNITVAKPKQKPAPAKVTELKLVPHKELIMKWLKLNMEPEIFVPGNILALPAFVSKYKDMIVTQWNIDPTVYGVNRLIGDLYYEYLDICMKKNETNIG